MVCHPYALRPEQKVKENNEKRIKPEEMGEYIK